MRYRNNHILIPCLLLAVAAGGLAGCRDTGADSIGAENRGDTAAKNPPPPARRRRKTPTTAPAKSWRRRQPCN